jgi:hypothetical protein
MMNTALFTIDTIYNIAYLVSSIFAHKLRFFAAKHDPFITHNTSYNIRFSQCQRTLCFTCETLNPLARSLQIFS